MMEPVRKKWTEVERGPGSRQGADGAPDLASSSDEDMRRQIGDVGSMLRKMCKASVTRKTLKEAVREALFPIIQEHRDELFPELAELRRRLAMADRDPTALDALRDASAPEGQAMAAAQSVASQIAESAGESDGVLRRRIEGVHERLNQLDEQFRTRLEGLRSDFDSLQTADESNATEIRQFKEQIDEQIRHVRSSMGELEASVPKTAETAAAEVESRLREEIAKMMEQLDGKLDQLGELLGRIERTVPSKTLVEGLDGRLDRIEKVFQTVSDRVESTTPEIQSLAGRFDALRAQIGTVSSDLRETGDGVGKVRELFGGRLDELQTELRRGIDRWESSESGRIRRLTEMRDGLREQLAEFQQQLDSKEASLWGKIRGKKDNALKLRAEEFDALHGKLEGVVRGLEKVIERSEERG